MFLLRMQKSRKIWKKKRQKEEMKVHFPFSVFFVYNQSTMKLH